MTPEDFIEHARARGRKVKSINGSWLVSCVGPNHARGDVNPSLHVSRGRTGDVVLDCKAGCDVRDVVDGFGLTMADLFAQPRERADRDPCDGDIAVIGAVYPYYDADGTLLYERLRLEHLVPGCGQRFAYQHTKGGRTFRTRGHDPVLFNLPALKAAAAAGARVAYCEGEKDAQTLIERGVVATTAGGVNDWRAEYAQHFLGARQVAIVADNDKPGLKLARQVEHDLRALGITTSVLISPFVKDVTEHVEVGHTLSELERIDLDITDVDSETPSGPRMRLRPFTEIAMRRATWLYEGRIQAKSLALLAGEPGVGKSAVALDIAARITRGTLEGEDVGRPRDVVIVATEDAADFTLKPRLAAADADMGRVFDIVVPAGDGISFPADVPDLEAAIAELDVALIILDPLTSRIGKALDTHNDQQVRQALEPLAQLADSAGTAVLGIIHLTSRAVPTRYAQSWAPSRSAPSPDPSCSP